jgi:hypothetical protein
MSENQHYALTNQAGYAPPPPAAVATPALNTPPASDIPVPAPYPVGYPGYPQPGYAQAGPPAGYAQPAYAAHPQAAYPQPYGLPQPGAYTYSPAAATQRPSVWPVVVLTLLFGVFGLIPASLRASNARRVGLSEKPYWQAWAITFACWIGLVLVL